MRTLSGKGNVGVFRRGGIVWELDLREGIDFAIYLQGGFEPAALREYRRVVKPGSVALDIGANIGSHTLPLAQIVGPSGRVYSFEPTDYAFEKQLRNLSLNRDLSKRGRSDPSPPHWLQRPAETAGYPVQLAFGWCIWNRASSSPLGTI